MCEFHSNLAHAHFLELLAFLRRILNKILPRLSVMQEKLTGEAKECVGQSLDSTAEIESSCLHVLRVLSFDAVLQASFWPMEMP